MVLSEYDRAHIGDIVAGHGDWFTAQIIRLCAKADMMNLERLRLEFPNEVAAYENWKNDPKPSADLFVTPENPHGLVDRQDLSHLCHHRGCLHHCVGRSDRQASRLEEQMTANEAHVRAVAEALATLGYGSDMEFVSKKQLERAIERHCVEAEVAVATLTPLIAAEVRAEVALLPAESMALTVALAQLSRGEDPTPNVSAALVFALARITGRKTP